MAAKGKKNNLNTYNGNMSFPYAALPTLRQQPGISPYAPKQQLQRSKKSSGKKRKKVDPNRKYRLEKEKRIRKGRDYFFVMRKFVCFLVFILFAVCLGVFALGYLNILPDYVSLFVEPDYTPKDERFTENEEGVLVEVEDKSAHYSAMDPISGFIKKMFGMENILGPSQKYDSMVEKAESGATDMITSMILTYFPIAMVLYILTALISMIKAFLAMFGKRIYRLFGLSAIWMIIFGAVTAIGGMASNLPPESALNFGEIVPFLMSYLTRMTNAGPQTAAGFGLFALLGVPVIIIILSMFMKRKVPYSIFD